MDLYQIITYSTLLIGRSVHACHYVDSAMTVRRHNNAHCCCCIQSNTFCGTLVHVIGRLIVMLQKIRQWLSILQQRYTDIKILSLVGVK